jgi:hypothetical protein
MAANPSWWNSTIPRISSKELSVTSFYRDFMIQNRPLIITNMTDGWEARNWTKDDGTVNTVKIQHSFGSSQVTVHNCSKQIKDMGRLETREMSIGEYLEWWKDRPASSSSQVNDLLYLKDWNFCKEFPGYAENVQFFSLYLMSTPPIVSSLQTYLGECRQQLYTTPRYFTQDWLNEHEQDQVLIFRTDASV